LIQFITEHPGEDFRILVLFKFFKSRVKSKLETDRENIAEELLNQLCLEKAKRFAALGIQPTEEDIKDLVASMQGRH
jgi:hypothetical protein